MQIMNMDNNKKIYENDEIDLRETFLSLWRGKFYIVFFATFFVFIASMYLQDAERLYLVESKLKPVGEAEQKNVSMLGGLASLSGFELPSNSTTDFTIFKELISSVEVSAIILKDKNLIRKIYNSEWDSSLNSFSEPPKSKSRAYLSDLKRIITGNNEVNYMPPNARRLAAYISQNIIITEDKDTGFLILTAETSKPDLLLSIISKSVVVADQIMRQRYINFSNEPLAFYKEKLRSARSREHREALAELIGQEEQKLMFASKGKYFTAEPYIEPTISLRPIAPKPKRILLMALILGSLVGCGIVYLHSKISRDKK
jgi:hypothetical protein